MTTKTAEQKRFPELHRIDIACGRKLAQAARALMQAREILRQVAESDGFTSQEQDATHAKVEDIVKLWGEVNRQIKHDPCESAAFWTDKDAADGKAPKAKPSCDLVATQPMEIVQ